MVETNRPCGVVHIVDDDEAVRDSLRWLLESNGFSVRAHADAQAFLDMLDPASAGCLILDVRMPGISGPELHDRLISDRSPVPVLFITGHGDVRLAVSRMKLGAFDFLEKPFNDAELCSMVSQMLELSVRRRSENARQQALRTTLERLTARESQVLERIVAGRLNKQIADDLGISIKTVEAHRANIMEKLDARSMADLMRTALRASDA